MKLNGLIKKLFTFDEFMRIYVIMFSIMYVLAIFNFLYLVNSIIGFFLYIGLMVGLFILIVLGLRFFQSLCRAVGMDKVYDKYKQGLKQSIKDRKKD